MAAGPGALRGGTARGPSSGDSLLALKVVCRGSKKGGPCPLSGLPSFLPSTLWESGGCEALSDRPARPQVMKAISDGFRLPAPWTARVRHLPADGAVLAAGTLPAPKFADIVSILDKLIRAPTPSRPWADFDPR